MKYFTQHLPTESHAYTLSTKTQNDISTGLQGPAGTSNRSSCQTPTKQSDNAYIKRIEDRVAGEAGETSTTRGCLDQAMWKRLKKLAKKTSHCLRKEPDTAKQAKKPEQSAPAYGEYSIPYIFC
ncbi:hypothetical protein J4E90_008751 [Alternaria incomplexa]|uniref:uncharacterized protein n=1 Tax=Alternaria incomplexa TaxID=1187928 RepID=UPI002220078A|nr:uncharacterized protein J4E90_008751 [Alternaria incomplexa]KAI4908127.1 hypothetical protein J4E90_008751 [Alternaria incomplexa]